MDRAFVLASGGMDRHLTYVAMTRHREQATLYAGRDDFGNHKEMAWRLARNRTNETTLAFAERRGIDTSRDWIDNGRALLNRARDRFEQAAARIGERLGLGRSLREELRSASKASRLPRPERGRRSGRRRRRSGRARPGSKRRQREPERPPRGMTPAARWKAAIEAEAKAVRAKALRTADKAEKRKAALTKKLDEIERAAPAKPGGFPA